MRRARAAAVLAVLATAGCAETRSAVESSADERAERAGIVMLRQRDGTAMDMARRVVGGDPGSENAIEVLVADGDRFDGRIVLRITERIEVGPYSSADRETVRCYEYDLANSIDDHEPDHVDCPDGEALVVPEATPPPTLPAGVEDLLRDRLAALGADVSEAQVRSGLAGLADDVERFDVTTVDGVIGVAVGNGDDECVFASLGPDGVEVWRVPRVVAQPGELGCSAGAAAQGLGTESPH